MMMSNKTPKFLLPLSLEDGAGSSSSSSSSSTSSSSIDLLTSLPEPLLLQILSFLPFRSAVQTSVLSSQWRHLYKKRAENLIISSSPTRFPSDIESSIAGGGSGLPLDSLHLIARCRHINEYLPHWLLLASGRRVRDVTIDLPGVAKPPLPATFVPFSSLTSLARLTLCGAQIDLRDHFVNLRSLEVLNLYRVWVSDRDLNTIVRGCSMLRTLDVRRCPGLLRLVVPTTAQWLRSLTVVDCPNLLEIRILGRARSFRRFHCCEGHVTTYHFDSLFKLELEDVYMSCSGKGMQARITNWWPALGRLCHVKVLTLCSRSLLTWMYISVPLLLYTGERILRTFRSKAYSVKIIKVALLPGSVLTLVMSKPHGFRYRSGQYIFLQCPAVSPFEWHPFSITSAPGDEYLSVHIRTTGDWTQELKRIFTEHYFTSGRAKLNELFSAKHKSLPRLLVDGPYGAPAQDFRNYDVLLLVGLGIGATPFISILRDLLNNIRLVDELLELTTETSRSDDSANSFGFSTPGSSSKKRPQRTASAHFYWVTREPGSFEWFKGVMNEVAEMDRKGVIEMHNYLTSVYEEGDARSTLLTMVQALNHAKNGFDIVSGTRVRTHFARPNWREVFTKLASKYQGATVGVFYCGTPGLAKELRSLSHEMSHKTSTRFHFHKEYF